MERKIAVKADTVMTAAAKVIDDSKVCINLYDVSHNHQKLSYMHEIKVSKFFCRSYWSML